MSVNWFLMAGAETRKVHYWNCRLYGQGKILFRETAIDNQTLEQKQPKLGLSPTESKHKDVYLNQVQADETREALIAICNVAIFVLLWGASSVWGLLSDFSGWVKLAIVAFGFPFWGLVVNRVFIRLSSSNSRSIDQS